MSLERDENNIIKPLKAEQPLAMRGGTPRLRTAPAAEKKDGEKAENSREKKHKPIGKEEIAKAKETLRKYISSKKRFDERFKDNYEFYNLLLAKDGNRATPGGDIIEEKMGAQSLNVISNKHADAMDNFPEPVFLPRAKDDEKVASELNTIVPTILEHNGFDREYSNAWYDKLVGGIGVYAVIWNKNLMNGLGDIEVKKADVLSIFWEPHIENIQDSKHIFYVNEYEIDEVKEMYPELKNVAEEALGLTEHSTLNDGSKHNNKAVVVDWYYKKSGKLHLVKFCGDEVIFASENEPDEYPNGYYAHGLYPYETDRCFYLPDMVAGFSLMDVCRAPQKYLDILNKHLLKNVIVNSQTRSLYNKGANINPNDLNDLSKDFIEADGDLSRVTRPLETKDIAAGSLNLYNAKVEEIKQTTGTNDASNGASAAGVTSGNAIAALQEAGGKISRDLCKQAYFCMTGVYKLVVELIREKYTLPRLFRITGENNSVDYVEFDNAELMKQPVEVDGSGEVFERLPFIDIKIKAQRQNPFATLANNQLMVDLFRAGAFAPQNAEAALVMLEGMTFEGKDKIVEMVRNNQTMIRQLQDVQNKLMMQEEMLKAQTAAAIQTENEPIAANESRGPII